jgi:serine-type D-Ala-D-Ala carboxypeptidase/endopeptidase
MRKLLLLITAICLACTVYADNQKSETEKYLTAANQIKKDYNAKNYAVLWKNFDNKYKEMISCEDFVNLFKTNIAPLGKLKKINNKPIIRPEYYVFKTRFNENDIYMYLALNSKGEYTKLFFLGHLLVQIKYPVITDKTTVDELANAYISKKVNTGLAIGIIDKGKVSTHFYGVVKKGSDIKPDKNSEFEIGSITKTFTAIALLEMQEQGLLKVTDPISKFLPKNVKVPTYDGKEITLENLVTQNSSLPCLPDNFNKAVKDPENPYADYTVKDLYNFLNSYKLTRPIGSKYEYSNFGFGLLGHILALKAGTTYEDVIKKEICDKLGMNNTCITLSTDQKKRMAQGYTMEGKATKNWDIPTLAGAGAIRSTISDMLKYLHANITKSNSTLRKAIQESHIVKFEEKNHNQASGWVILNVADKDVIFHNGGTGGFRSFLGFFKGTETGVVILSNSAVTVDELGIKILEMLALDMPKEK